MDNSTGPVKQRNAFTGLVRTHPVLVIAVSLVVLTVVGVVAFVLADRGPSAARERTAFALDLPGRHGKGLTAQEADAVRKILTERLRATGFGHPEVLIVGGSVTAFVDGKHGPEAIGDLLAPGHLGFRKILDGTDGSGPPGVNTQSATEPEQSARLKLGPALAAAEALTAPAEPDTAALAPFSKLSPAEVGVLPAAIQFNVPQISCAMLDARPSDAVRDVTRRAVACEREGKYLLDVAKLGSADIAKTAPHRNDQTAGWEVGITFSEGGTPKWTDLTREAVSNDSGACRPAAVGDRGKCRIAIVLDGRIISSPQILAVLASQTVITGDFTQRSAQLLAAQLKFGALPVPLAVSAAIPA